MGKTQEKPLRTGGAKHVRKHRAAKGPVASLADLIVAQQVKPVTDLDELGRLWPAEDDPKAFLAFLDEERCARRAAVNKRKGR